MDSPLKVDRLPAVPASRIEAVLKPALLVEPVERPIAERNEDDDSEQGEEVAATAGLVFLAPRWRLAHAMRPVAALTSISPSAASALATMPFASNPAAAYMRSGLS